MRRGGGSHKSQGILSSSWGDRGWEGEGASTGMGKHSGMRNDGNEGGGGNSQVRWNGLCGGMCLKECWEKQPHFPARRDFPTFCRFSVPLLQELGSPGSPTLPSPNYPSWRGHGNHGRSQPHHCGSQVPSTNPNPTFFHSRDRWEARPCSTARGMAKQPWHGHFSLQQGWLSPNPGRFWEQNIPGDPGNASADGLGQTDICPWAVIYVELGNGSSELE